MGINSLLSILPDSKLLLLHVGIEAQRPLTFQREWRCDFLVLEQSNLYEFWDKASWVFPAELLEWTKPLMPPHGYLHLYTELRILKIFFFLREREKKIGEGRKRNKKRYNYINMEKIKNIFAKEDLWPSYSWRIIWKMGDKDRYYHMSQLDLGLWRGAFLSDNFLKQDKSWENENPGRKHKAESLPWKGCQGKPNIRAGRWQDQSDRDDSASVWPERVTIPHGPPKQAAPPLFPQMALSWPKHGQLC